MVNDVGQQCQGYYHQRSASVSSGSSSLATIGVGSAAAAGSVAVGGVAGGGLVGGSGGSTVTATTAVGNVSAIRLGWLRST